MSENVADYLGISMVSRRNGRVGVVGGGVRSLMGLISKRNSFLFQIDVLQGDTFCDMVESADADVVKANLDLGRRGSGELRPAGRFRAAPA